MIEAYKYFAPFYKQLREQADNNIARAQIALNFSTGFIGVLVGGFAYITSQVDWCLQNQILFSFVCFVSLLFFFATVFISHFYIRSFRVKVVYPWLEKPEDISRILTEEQFYEFEAMKHRNFKDLLAKMESNIYTHEIIFTTMLSGLTLFTLASALTFVFELGG